MYAYVFVCPSVCVVPPNPENRHSSAEDLPTKFTKGYWERPERTEILCTEWMWPWEVWERHGLRNITKLLLKSSIGQWPSTFKIGAWRWPYVRHLCQTESVTQVCETSTEKNALWIMNEPLSQLCCHFSRPKYMCVCDTHNSLSAGVSLFKCISKHLPYWSALEQHRLFPSAHCTRCCSWLTLTLELQTGCLPVSVYCKYIPLDLLMDFSFEHFSWTCFIPILLLDPVPFVLDLLEYKRPLFMQLSFQFGIACMSLWLTHLNALSIYALDLILFPCVLSFYLIWWNHCLCAIADHNTR